MFKNLKLKGKIGLGFGVILLMLATVASWAVFGISDIINDANEVIARTSLEALLCKGRSTT